MFGGYFPQWCFGGEKRQKLMKLFDMAEERLEKEMNMVKMIKGLRTIKILMKNSLLSKEIQDQISHTDKNIINLDTSSSESDADYTNT